MDDTRAGLDDTETPGEDTGGAPETETPGREGAVPGVPAARSPRRSLRLALGEFTDTLTAAGVDSPRADAELIAADVLGIDRGRLGLTPLVDDAQVIAMSDLVHRRAAREPLQHLLGVAHFGELSLEIGPGVFIPRPETEALLEWALDTAPRLRTGSRPPVILDLCTGSGALALSLAHAFPEAKVHAVERDGKALAWARRNADARAAAGDTPITLHHGDVTDRTLLAVLDGTVDLLVANPPYVPEGTETPPEVADHDPAVAVFAGVDGLDVIRPLVYNVARWLRIDGHAGIEHDECHAEEVAELFRARRVLGDVTVREDLTGRARFTVMTRIATEAERTVAERPRIIRKGRA